MMIHMSERFPLCKSCRKTNSSISKGSTERESVRSLFGVIAFKTSKNVHTILLNPFESRDHSLVCTINQSKELKNIFCKSDNRLRELIPNL